MSRQTVMGVDELILRKMATFRRWKKTKLYRRQSKWGFNFTVMTYNILSQAAVENHRNLYKHCSPAFLMEDYRTSRILPEIIKSKSDIICLQEVEEHVFHNTMKKVLDSNGFMSIYKKRTGFKTDGCAILWRRNKFQFVDQMDVEFRSVGNNLLDRDNIGLIAVLKPNNPYCQNVLLHIATTHLLFNPKRGDIKLCQLRWLLAELERLSLREVKNDNRYYHPVILCGDFNIEPHSLLYQFIETGCIDLENVLSGNMSGQRIEGQKKGRPVDRASVSLQKLGINETGRFEDAPKLNDASGTGSFKSPTAAQSNPNPSLPNGYSIEQSLAKAMRSSTDARWLTLGNKELTETVASRMLATDETEKTKPDSNTGPTPGNNDSSCFYHDFKFVPAYKYHHTNPKDIPITSMTGRDFNNVDHIFYNVKNKKDLTSYKEGKLKLLSIYSLMSSEQVEEIGGLPNAGLGSDHICLMSKFAICLRR